MLIFGRLFSCTHYIPKSVFSMFLSLLYILLLVLQLGKRGTEQRVPFDVIAKCCSFFLIQYEARLLGSLQATLAPGGSFRAPREQLGSLGRARLSQSRFSGEPYCCLVLT